VLVGGRGTLFAIFRPTVVELRDPSLLLLRLGISRLALPETTRTVLVRRPDREEPEFLPFASGHFEHIVTEQDSRGLLSFIRQPGRPGNEGAAIRGIREQAHVRAYRVLEISRDEMAERPIQRPPPEVLVDELLSRGYNPVRRDQWAPISGRRRRHSLNLFQRDDSVVADVRLRPRRSPVEALKTYTLAGVGLSYGVDSGIPYPAGIGPLKIICLDTRPTARYDPEKPIRALALAGWVVTFPQSIQQVESLHNRLRRTIPEDRR
jgi:hypothetical protein